MKIWMNGFISLLGLLIISGKAVALEKSSFPDSVYVYYDQGEPRQSLVIIGDDFYKVGGSFGMYEIVSAATDSVVLHDHRSFERMRVFNQGDVDAEFKALVLYEFIVNQLRLIYEAQARYYARYDSTYAQSLEDLMRQSFLANGFDQGVKRGYRFEILEAVNREGSEATFRAIAEPMNVEHHRYFFSVDELAQVRYGESRDASLWGAVWKYAEDLMLLKREDFVHKNDEELLAVLIRGEKGR